VIYKLSLDSDLTDTLTKPLTSTLTDLDNVDKGPTNARLLENGGVRLLEDNKIRILE